MYENLPEGYSRNERPCGLCARYRNDLPLGSRCGKFHHTVSPTDHVIYQTSEPCYVRLTGKLLDQRFVPPMRKRTIIDTLRSLFTNTSTPT